MAKGKGNAAERYIAEVQAGRIVVGNLVRLAVERHVRDLETAKERGLRFEKKAGQRVLDFFSHLRHSKGEWAGHPFVLAAWQAFILWVLFGWLRVNGTRRFKTAYIEVRQEKRQIDFGCGRRVVFIRVRL